MPDRIPLQLFSIGIILGSLIIVPVQSLGFILPKIPLFAVSAFSGLIYLIRSKNVSVIQITKTKAGKFMLLFFLTILLSQLWSVAPIISLLGTYPRFEGSLFYIIFLVICAVAFVLTLQNKTDFLINTVVFTNIIVVIYGLMQMIGLDPLLGFWQIELFLGRAFSTIGQPNFLGVFLLLTLPFVFIKKQSAIGRSRIFLSTLFLLNLLLIAGTASRSAYLGVAVMALFFISANCGQIRQLKDCKSESIKVLTIVIAFLITLIAISALAQRFSVHTQNVFLGSRSVIWSTTSKMIDERPIGYGLETMSLISPRFSDKKLFEFESLPTIIDRAHSKPLDLLFTLGPLGLITYYLFLYFILTSLWKRRRNELALACFLSIAGTSSALIFGFDTFVTHIFFWLISGVSLGLITIENSVKRPNLELIIKYILLLLTTVCLLISLMWILARAELEESEEQMALGNIVNSVSKGFDASAHFPFDRAILVQSAEKALVAHENTDNEQNREALNQFVENVLNKLEDLTKGQDGMVYIMRSWNAAIRAEDENVEMYISQALDKHPNYVLTYRIAIHSYDILGNSEKKKEMEQKILDILPSYWDDVESEQRRILLKENPWLEEIGLQ